MATKRPQGKRTEQLLDRNWTFPIRLCREDVLNDRLGGWQLMYQMLQKGEWQIADTCPKLIEAIPSRIHDEKRPGVRSEGARRSPG